MQDVAATSSIVPVASLADQPAAAIVPVEERAIVNSVLRPPVCVDTAFYDSAVTLPWSGEQLVSAADCRSHPDLPFTLKGYEDYVKIRLIPFERVCDCEVVLKKKTSF